MKFNSKTYLLGLSALAFAAQAQVGVNIDLGKRGPAIGDLHYGIFYEEINHAGDGGLYAELLRNRSFEDNANNPETWTKVGKAGYALVHDNLLPNNASALEVTFNQPGDGFSNNGYWGINAVEGRKYDFSMMVRGDYSGTLTVLLCKADGTSLGSTDIKVDSDGKWRKITGSLTATGSDPKAWIRIISDRAGKLTVDCVSLFPPTYKDRVNGCRPDLAQMLADMKPAFVRFPGGCYVEGTGGEQNRFIWKNTIGPIEERPGHWNGNWGYRSSDGFGFHEMLQLTEDLGAEPLFVVNIGMGHGWQYAYDDIDFFIQEALDAIEYCNGDATTKWGKMRAENGHPEPFGLRLLEIGNENYQQNPNEQSDHYAERYKQFYDAIKAVYPDMVLIGNVESWGTDSPSWRNPYPCEVVDEHYYRNPGWFENMYAKYDNYDRSKPKVYVGEYAVTQDFGTNGHLEAALGEATYMLGMENNSDVCVMNSYAPIFVNENDQKWMPDMIRFNSEMAYGTPSYHVQSLMANLHGKQNVKWTETGNLAGSGNKMGLSTWSTAATFDNVKVTAATGTIFSDDFSKNEGWTSKGGSWSVADGALKQTDASMQGKIYVCDTELPDSYTLELDATKDSGAEGFLIAFNYADDKNYCWWNLGGWGNASHGIEVCTNGSKSTYDRRDGKLVNGKTYRLKIEVAGEKVKCYIDGELIHDVTLPAKRKVYLASSIDQEAGLLYVKLVNNSGDAQEVTLSLAGGSFDGVEDITVLASASNKDENDNDNRTRVAPAAGAIDRIEASKAVYTVPAYSLNILRLRVSDIATVEPGKPATDEQKAAMNEFFAPLAQKLGWLHASTALPTGTSDGASIKWQLSGASKTSLSDGLWATTLVVSKLSDKEENDGTLKALVTFPTGEEATFELPVRLAASDGMYGYLYTYMKSNKEITNYALGTRADGGRTFNELLGGAEIFDTEAIAAIEGGTRDAYLGRGEDADSYFITVTDMCNAKSGKWNNYGIDLVRSTDLVHWEGSAFDFRKGKSIFSDADATTDAYKTDAEYANINRVWAPQWIWDPVGGADGKGAYLVYYSILSSNSGDNHDRVFYSYADKDFKTLTQPRVFYDPGYSVIDADIVFNKYDNMYYMCIKHEGSPNEQHGVYILRSDKLVGGEWKQVIQVRNEGNALVEGATLMRRIDEDAYNLYYMRYSDGSAYKVCDLDHLCGNAGASSKLGGKGNFQHGSVIPVTEDEYNVLQGYSDLMQLIADAKASGSKAYEAAIKAAEEALDKNRTVASLAVEIPKAIEALKAAREDFVKELIDGKDSAELTSLLSNPAFSTSGGWSGTAFTAISNGVAEHYNKTFDTYQVLEYMPAGYYTLTCSGFYRYGGKDGYNSHKDGTEVLNAKLYINDAEEPFMSLFSSEKYTNSPYSFPDNMTQANNAFNTDKQYGDNSVVFHLEQTGDLRIGVRKTELRSTDWTCFDNFRLYYSRQPSGIEAVTANGDELVNVYTSTGVLLRASVSRADAVRGLDTGIYIVGGKKVFVR